MRHLGQRVGLIHELRELARSKKLLDDRRHRFGVYEFLRHQVLGFGQTQAFLDRAFDAHKPDPELVLGELAHGAHAAVAEVIDIVDLALAVFQADQHLHDVDDVVATQDARTLVARAPEAAIEFHAPDCRKIVAVETEKQARKEVLRGLLRGRLTGAHHAIDLDLRLHGIARRIDPQRVGNIRTAVELVCVERADLGDSGLHELLDQVCRHHLVGLGDEFPGAGVDDVLAKRAPRQKRHDMFRRDRKLRHLGLVDLAHMARGDALILLHDHLARRRCDVEIGLIPAQPLRDELKAHVAVGQQEGIHLKKRLQDILACHAERAQKGRGRQLAAPIDAHIQEILRVELEIEPRTAIRDDARREQQLPG